MSNGGAETKTTDRFPGRSFRQTPEKAQSEFGGEITVDFHADADFFDTRCGPGHVVFLRFFVLGQSNWLECYNTGSSAPKDFSVLISIQRP